MEKLGTACQLRLVVLDIDGTLTDPAGDITPPVQAAVTALLQRDILVVVATGRNLAEMDQVWEIWPQLTRIVYSNGAAITGMGQPLDGYFQGIPAAVARKVYQAAMAADTMPEIYANGKIYVEASRWEKRVYYRAQYLEETTPGSRTPIPSLEAILSQGDPRIEKVNVFFPCDDHRLSFEAANQGIGLRTSHTIQGGLEFNNPNATKAEAVAHICKALGIPAQAVAALGDSLTDKELLQWAGCSFAMGNALPDVQACAKQVAPPPTAKTGPYGPSGNRFCPAAPSKTSADLPRQIKNRRPVLLIAQPLGSCFLR